MKRPAAILLAVSGGALEALALPLVVPFLSLRQVDPAGHLEWIAWVGLVPVLLALDGARSWKGALGLGLAAGVAYFYVAIYWVNHAMTAFGGLSVGLAFLALTLLVLYMAAHWALSLAVSWTIRSRLGWPFAWHLPLVWAAAELLRNYLFTGFPWANLGYSQVRHLPVAQLASLFGVYAVASLVVLVNCSAYQAVRARLDGGRFPVRLVAVTGLVLVAVVAYGLVHLRAVRLRMAAAPRLTVGLVQGNVNQALKNQAASYADWILGRYWPLTAEADRRGADLVAWPEATYPRLVAPGLESFAGSRTGLAPLARAHLLLGASTVEWHLGRDGRRVPEVTNSLFLLGPDLGVLGRYVKHHLVPFGEYVPLADWLPFVRQVVPQLAPVSAGRELKVLRFPLAPAPGTPAGAPAASPDSDAASTEAAPSRAAAASQAPRPTPASAGMASLAPMICYDAIFPQYNLAYAGQAPDFLVNPTNDAWYGYSSGPYQFLAIVQMRAIEAGKAVARPAYAGVTAIILPTGEVAPGAIEVGPVDPDLAPDPDEPPRLLLGELPRLQGRTLYTSIGDVFAWTAALAAAVSLGAALRAKPPRNA